MREIREFDERRRLIAAGYEWEEFNALPMIAAACLTLLGIYMLTALVTDSTPGTQKLVAIACLSAFPLALYIIVYHRLRKRSLIFTLNGEMLMPHGIPGYWRWKHIPGHHERISSIAIEQDEDAEPELKQTSHRLTIYFTTGDILRVTTGLPRDAAHRVVVQLSSALAAIRRDGGKPPSRT